MRSRHDRVPRTGVGRKRLPPGLVGSLASATVAVAATAAVAALAGCANEQPPPGALPDTRPPAVARFVPARDSVVPELGGSARILFDEPVNLSGDMSRRIRASPAYRYEFGTGFSEIRIRPQGGWRPGAVYCFEVEAGIVDMLGNRTPDPIPYCFSTGPAVPATRVEGRVVDRVTGNPVGGARVLFLGLPEDTIPYTAEADGQGAFLLRAVPPDEYRALAFLDRNRDLRLDRRLEPYDSLAFSLAPEGAAGPLELSLVEPDSTPPVLASAGAEDSLTLRLEFDDPLRLEQADAAVVVTDSAGAELAVRLIHVGPPGTLPPEARAAPAEAPADTAGEAGAPADTAGQIDAPPDTAGQIDAPPDTVGQAAAPPDTAAQEPPPEATGEPPPVEEEAGPVEEEAGPPEQEPEAEGAEAPAEAGPPARTPTEAVAPEPGPGPGAGPTPGQELERRPSRAVTVLLGAPLAPGTHALTTRGFVNLRGLVGGGDTTFVFTAGAEGR